MTLVDCNIDTLGSHLADTVSGKYWTFTDDIFTSNYAWVVDFYNGVSYINIKGDTLYVRCVRDGTTSLDWSISSINSMNWPAAVNYAKSLVAPVYYKGQEIIKLKKDVK
jgi:hypothetical protein